MTFFFFTVKKAPEKPVTTEKDHKEASSKKTETVPKKLNQTVESNSKKKRYVQLHVIQAEEIDVTKNLDLGVLCGVIWRWGQKYYVMNEIPSEVAQSMHGRRQCFILFPITQISLKQLCYALYFQWHTTVPE